MRIGRNTAIRRNSWLFRWFILSKKITVSLLYLLPINFSNTERHVNIYLLKKFCTIKCNEIQLKNKLKLSSINNANGWSFKYLDSWSGYQTSAIVRTICVCMTQGSSRYSTVVQHYQIARPWTARRKVLVKTRWTATTSLSRTADCKQLN